MTRLLVRDCKHYFRSWLGFLDTCRTEAPIIVHGQVFEKLQGRKPREKDAAVSGVQWLWGLNGSRVHRRTGHRVQGVAGVGQVAAIGVAAAMVGVG